MSERPPATPHPMNLGGSFALTRRAIGPGFEGLAADLKTIAAVYPELSVRVPGEKRGPSVHLVNAAYIAGLHWSNPEVHLQKIYDRIAHDVPSTLESIHGKVARLYSIIPNVNGDLPIRLEMEPDVNAQLKSEMLGCAAVLGKVSGPVRPASKWKIKRAIDIAVLDKYASNDAIDLTVSTVEWHLQFDGELQAAHTWPDEEAVKLSYEGLKTALTASDL